MCDAAEINAHEIEIKLERETRKSEDRTLTIIFNVDYQRLINSASRNWFRNFILFIEFQHTIQRFGKYWAL